MKTDTPLQSNAMTDDLVILDFSAGFHCTITMIFLGSLRSKCLLGDMGDFQEIQFPISRKLFKDVALEFLI
jgi:hypothetical protein